MATAHEYKEARTPKSRGKTVDRIEVSEGEDGGHVVRHHFKEDGMEYHKPKEYVFGADEGSDLIDHLRKHAHIATGPKEPHEGDPEDDGE